MSRPPSDPQPPWLVLVAGLATTAMATFAAVVLLFSVGLSRCGGFFGESSAVPGTLSQRICGTNLGDVLAWVAIGAPLVLGIGGSIAAAHTRAHRTWGRPLIAGSVVAAAVILTVAVSGEV